MNVSDIMTQEVVSVAPETPVSEIANLLYKYKISGVPVVQGNKIVGIVTEEDLIMRDAIIREPHVINVFDSVFYLGNRREFSEEMRHVLATTAAELMTKRVYTIAATASVETLASLMIKHEINPVPVVDATGNLCGVVSRADIVRLMALERDEGVGLGGPDTSNDGGKVTA
jgi:CBS domain-containing protein